MPVKKGFIKSKIYTALLLLFVLILVGTLGFMSLADFEVIEAIYMTVITVSTVGFSEVRPLDLDAKIFTIFLIITSVSIFGYVISVITEYIANNKLIEELKFRKVEKKIASLKGHTIVCGYGRNGKQAAKKLLSYEKQFVVIEKDKAGIL